VFNEKDFLKYLIGKGFKDRQLSVPLLEKASPHHGVGLFATADITKGTSFGFSDACSTNSEANLLAMMAKTNDLLYSHCVRHLSSSALTSLTAIDYSEFVREYTNHSNIQTCTNTYTLYTNGVTSLGAMKDISAGEEISRYYGLHFWLHHHLNHLLSTGDKGVYDPKHPLVGTILGLKDPSSVECFSKIRTHFNIWD